MFGSSCALVGCVHCLPLPGSAGYGGAMRPIVERAVREARIYAEEGFEAAILENLNDRPYLRGRVHPETTAAMAAVAHAVRDAVKIKLGVQLLAAANREALAVAVAGGLDFIRVEGFSYAHTADEGIIEAQAGELLRARAALHAEAVQVWADVRKKHASHALTADLGLTEIARGTEFMRADAIVVTGSFTGEPPALEPFMEARGATHLPFVVGSGITQANLPLFLRHAQAMIVGTACKEDARIENPVDPARCRGLVEARRGGVGGGGA